MTSPVVSVSNSLHWSPKTITIDATNSAVGYNRPDGNTGEGVKTQAFWTGNGDINRYLPNNPEAGTVANTGSGGTAATTYTFTGSGASTNASNFARKLLGTRYEVFTNNGSLEVGIVIRIGDRYFAGDVNAPLVSVSSGTVTVSGRLS